MSKTILVVDDEERIVSLVKAYLEQAGYRVVTANNGRNALFAARDHKPDLIVLDVMMPELDGTEFMRLHKKEANTPIILLTAKVEESDKVLGLELGADDYVTKPFSPRELTARVKAVLRRAGLETPTASLIRHNGLELDPSSYRVTLNNNPISLTRSEFDLLMTMMSNPGRAYSRGDLLDYLQGPIPDSFERTIDVHIKNIRAKIEDNPRKPQFIETVYGVGYRFSS